MRKGGLINRENREAGIEKRGFPFVISRKMPNFAPENVNIDINL